MLPRIVQPSPALESFLDSLHLPLSQPQRDHLLHLVDGSLVCEERKTLAALQRQFLDSTDPSNWADFLRISPWFAEDVRCAIRRHQVAWLVAEAQRRSLPKVLYVNLDDSLGKKDKRTSRLEPVDWFHDHNESRLGSSPGNTCPMGWDFLNCLFPPCWGGLSPQAPFHGGNRHGLSGYFVDLGHAM